MIAMIDHAEHFANRQFAPHVESFDKNNEYPIELFESMKSECLFGSTIPKFFGGLEENKQTGIQVTEELSSSSITLSSILHSYLPVCDYIIYFDTNEQKNKYLPLLGKRDLISAYADQGKNKENLESYEIILKHIDASLEKWSLSSTIEWIINLRNAHIFGASFCLRRNDDSRLSSIQSCAILIKKRADRLQIEKVWNRVSVKGVSLTPVTLSNYLIDIRNLIGKFNADGKKSVDLSYRYLSIVSSVFSIGIAKKLIEKLSFYLIQKTRNGITGNLIDEPVLRLKLEQLVTKFYAAQSLFNECCSNFYSVDKSKFTSCRLVLTETIKDILLTCLQLSAQSGYTFEFESERYLRDASSLTINHAATDISLNRPGHITLDESEIKEQNSSSIFLHYASKVLPHIRREFLLKATLEEQEHIIDAGYYRDTKIKLYLYDMTTKNPSGTFKDFLGCLTFAYCLQNGIDCICAQSSGNTAMSLIHYARKNPSIKLIQFYLKENSYKINSKFVPDNVILIEINSSEAEMKRILKRFSDLTNIPIMPNFNIQIEANQIRAYIVNDYSNQNKIPFNWYVQSLSSAFGPLGLYHGFKSINSPLLIPKLLGIQQQARCPYARALGFYNEPIDENIPLLEPTLFRSEPGDLVDKVKHILDTFGGKLKVLTNENFYQYIDEAISILSKNNIHITKMIDGNILEKAGIIALAATLHEINQNNLGSFSGDENILIGITGGTACPALEKPIPKFIFNENPTDEQLKLILQ